MDKRDKINTEVQKTLDSPGQMERLEANPYFQTRLEASIRELETSRVSVKGQGFSLSYVFSAALVLLATANIYIAVSVFQDSSGGQTIANRETILSSFAEEYSMGQNEFSLYGDE